MRDLKVARAINVFDTDVVDPIATFKTLLKKSDGSVRFNPEFLTEHPELDVIGNGCPVVVIHDFDDWTLVSLVGRDTLTEDADEWAGLKG